MSFSAVTNGAQIRRDLLGILLAGMAIRCLLLYLFPVPYGEDAFGRLYFKDQIFLAHWLPLTQLLVHLGSQISSDILPTRLLFAFLGSLSACGFYLFMRGVAERRTACRAGLLFTVNALFVLLSLMPYQDVLFLGLFYASLSLLVADDPRAGPPVNRLAPDGSGARAIGGSLLLGLACLTRYEAWFLLPFFAIWEIRNLPGLARLPWSVFKVGVFYGWAPLLWISLSRLHYGTWSGFLFQTRSGEFYAFNPHVDVAWMFEYGARMLYWLGLFGSPVVLLSVVGLERLARRRRAWHPRLKWLLLACLAVTLFFFVVIGKEQDTVFRFSAFPLSVLLVFVAFGWEGLEEWLRRRPRLRFFSGPALFPVALAALAVYAAVPVARLNADPAFRDPWRVANLLKRELGAGDTAVILAPGSDDPAEAAPLAHQRVAAQSGRAAERIRSARLIDLRDEKALLDYSARAHVARLVVFRGFEARAAAERFYGRIVQTRPEWLTLTDQLETAAIYTVSVWPPTLEDFD